MESYPRRPHSSITVALFVSVIFAATALIVTWPLARDLHHVIPIGTEHEATVPLFNTWTLWWTANRSAHGFEHYWQAPIFFPHEGAFSFSEPQPLTGILALPLWRITSSLPAVYNLTVLGLLFLNGVFAYRLGRALTFTPAPSIIAGILTIGLPIIGKFLGVLPLLPVFGMLWALEGFVRFGDKGSTQSALWAGAGLLSLFLTSQQLALMFSPFALLAGLMALWHRGFSLASWCRLGAVAAIVAGTAVWFAWYPLQLHEELGFSRKDSLVQSLSARPANYATKPLTATWPVPARETLHSDTGGLFPGLGLLLLAVWGTLSTARHPSRSPWLIYFVVSGLLALTLSFGLNVSIGSWQPFQMLREWIPGFQALRSPFRFSIIAQLCATILSLWGLMALCGQRSNATRTALMVILGVLCFSENLTIPQPLASANASSPAWATWLRSQTETRVVAHVPFPNGLHVADYEIETRRMLTQTVHRKALVNGYSGYFPPAYGNFQLDMARNFPNEFLLCFLAGELHVDAIVMDTAWQTEHESSLVPYVGWLPTVYTDQDVVIASLRLPNTACHGNTHARTDDDTSRLDASSPSPMK